MDDLLVPLVIGFGVWAVIVGGLALYAFWDYVLFYGPRAQK